MESEEVPMRKVIASEILSLDGVMESPEKWSFQFHNDQMEEAIGAAMAQADAMLLGRVTYEGFAAFWPSQQGGDDEGFAGYMNNTPKYVISSTLEEPPRVEQLVANRGQRRGRDPQAEAAAR